MNRTEETRSVLATLFEARRTLLALPMRLTTDVVSKSGRWPNGRPAVAKEAYMVFAQKLPCGS